MAGAARFTGLITKGVQGAVALILMLSLPAECQPIAGGIVNRALRSRHAQIYTIDPYQPGKIPVLLIHGLWTSPRVWATMIGTLRSDPVLRARFQFWVASYPSDHPLPVAAESVRQSLRQIRRTFDPAGADPALDQMVILGKSTGGQVTRMLVQSSGQGLWNAVFTQPPEQVQSSPERRARLSSTLFYEPEPYVKRVIFVTTGHRGSEAAEWPFGVRLGVDLMSSKSPSRAEHAELVATNGRAIFQPFLRNRPLSAFDGMRKDSLLLRAIDRQPFAPGLPYHSIIGNIRRAAFLEQMSDGFISYQSAHLDGAASEQIIATNHRCEANPEVIAEVRRILLVHLAESP
jgi:pimeloyl-ACP methyl ester carboxylesterase